LKYSKFLKDEEGREAEFEKWNVNTDVGLFGPPPVEPLVYYSHQSVGKYDISGFGEPVGDIWFPTKDIAKSKDL
jgi:hypothetical protein